MALMRGLFIFVGQVYECKYTGIATLYIQNKNKGVCFIYFFARPFLGTARLLAAYGPLFSTVKASCIPWKSESESP